MAIRLLDQAPPDAKLSEKCPGRVDTRRKRWAAAVAPAKIKLYFRTERTSKA